MYAFMRWLMRTLTRTYLFGLFKVVGRDNVPRSGPLIICPSHSATLDPPMVPAFVPRGDTWSMAKSEYFKGGFVTWLFRQYHAFPVVRHSADRVALRRSFDLLKAGHALIIYPEGTRVESGVLAEPEPGAGFIARRSGAPLVPIAITGTQHVLGRQQRFPRAAEVSMTFGEPFNLPERNQDGSPMDHQQSADYLMTKIAELLPLENQGEYASSPMSKSAQA